MVPLPVAGRLLERPTRATGSQPKSADAEQSVRSAGPVLSHASSVETSLAGDGCRFDTGVAGLGRH
ncbi:hypothetical protein CP557_04665 [Natrinema ejinorense]|uniref:Uncharacterized protein n=1 Tax=Natrinema ejinorense TaxID=373386 RepID=A0A2A5QSS3_9EURY|nr:hypothetical protein CP557_04665 [Natrinema ejinorense]